MEDRTLDQPLTRGAEHLMKMSYETEADFLSAIIDLAHLNGWAVAHFRPGRTSYGWATPVQGDGAGFTDLVLVGGSDEPFGRARIIYAEVKSETGELSWDQAEWLTMLQDAGAEVYAWWPSDWDELVKILKGDR